MLRIRAKSALTMSGPPLADAAVLIDDDGTIAAVGRQRDVDSPPGAAAIDFGECVLLPGLINAHCHLDFSMLRGGLLNSGRFADWIVRINALKRNLSLEDFRRAIDAGIAEALEHGTTSLVNIESFPELLIELPRTPLRVWWCLELMDIRKRIASERFSLGCLRALEPQCAAGATRFGLSPHSPYTASGELFRLAARVAATHGMLFTTHVSESADEIEMFTRAGGGLHDLVATVGGPPLPQRRDTPLGSLASAGLIPEHALLVHMNGLAEADFDWLAAHAARRRLSVAHCPQSHAFFAHPPFDYHRLRAAGVNICLGTDSLASSPSLSLFDEMRAFAMAFPGVPPAETLELATTNAAAALGHEGRLGTLAPGAAADLVLVPQHSADPAESALAHRGPVAASLLGGRLLTA